MLEVLELNFGFQFFMHPRTMKFYLRILHTHLITWNGALNFAWNLLNRAFCCFHSGWQRSPYFSCVLGDRVDSVFFIAPLQRYQYTMPSDLVPDSCKPSWVGKDGQTSPFQSCWYVYLPPSFNFTKFLRGFEVQNGQVWPLRLCSCKTASSCEVEAEESKCWNPPEGRD